MKFKSELRWLWRDVKVWAEKRAATLWSRLPEDWRHTAVAWEIGRLTTEPRLSRNVVGDVTVSQLFDTMRDIASPGWDGSDLPPYKDVWLAPINVEQWSGRVASHPPLDYRRLADADLVITLDGWVIKDRYGPGDREATIEEIRAANRTARREMAKAAFS